ncbi:putative phosphonate ABC transporter [Prochlorococcus marinus str. MIT 9515]|uniref:Putative phosphonate ABC transporter n=1 Tax=Prochlorococcus marinus (strain MIT 9515) TaxID=167542 RepID=A2BVZ2_PROM5|nr:hypothetical protein [Prochlorococcus marinus]ABM71953.1 putative phosphonate ABC transporter [Prochlorococcus marinus str. MIT 9515]
MNKLKLNPTSISFLPVIVCIPLAYELLNNFHIGGIELFKEFIISSINPKINNEIIIILIERLNETIFIAFFSWLVSIIFGVVFGILSSDILYEIFILPKFLKKFLKFLLTISRSIHEIIWGIILMQIYGINFSVGIIAICIPFIAINAKVISEQLENINIATIESIKQINGIKFSSLITLVWSPIIETLKNFGLYRLECSIRSTAVLGLFGIGGIGTSIFLSFQTLNFRELWTYLWGLAFLIIISNELLKRINILNFSKNVLIFYLIAIFSISLFSLSFFVYFIFNKNTITFNSINNIFNSNSILFSYDYLKLLFDTIVLSLFSTGIAISFPPIYLLIFNNKTGIIILKSTSFLFRLIPAPIIILILLMFNNPTISLAATTLGFHNAAVTSKLLLENLHNQDKKEYIAMKSIGVSKRSSWLYGIFVKQARSYLAYCAYRSDIIIRETAILGIIGSVGLGWQLQESLSSFAWEEVLIILFSYSSIAILGELINGKIKSNLA